MSQEEEESEESKEDQPDLNEGLQELEAISSGNKKLLEEAADLVPGSY